MRLKLGICSTLNDHKIIGIDVPHENINVKDFKKLVSEEVNFLEDNIELSFRGILLTNEQSLAECGLKEGFLVNVLHKKEKDYKAPIIPITSSDIPEITKAFNSLSRNAYKRVLQNLTKTEELENVIAATPGLENDPQAIILLQHPELMARLNDKEDVLRLIEKHPALAHAANNLVAAAQSDFFSVTASSSSAVSPLLRDNHFSVDSDDDDDDDEDAEMTISDNESQANTSGPRRVITSSDVAAALANTSSSSSNPAARSNITTEMMSSAILRAFAASSSGASNTATTNTPPATTSGNSSLQTDHVTMEKLEQMRLLGFHDDGVNIRALQVTNGDVEAAINFILNYPVDEA